MNEQNSGMIKQAQTGDLVAWESLLAAVYPPALRQARALLRDADLAEDAVQNALIKMHKHLHALVEITAFSAWWRRIVTNEVYMILRLKQRETQGLDEGIFQQIGLAVDELVVLRCELARALQLLPFDQQQVVIDVDLMGVSLLEVAGQKQIPLGVYGCVARPRNQPDRAPMKRFLGRVASFPCGTASQTLKPRAIVNG